jgi:hypothetical protein
MQNALFYKGEDIAIKFQSTDSMADYTKSVKLFTPFSTVKTATIQTIDNNTFIASVSDTDTLDMTPGRLNVVLEFVSSSGKIISKTIHCRIADPYIDGNQRESNNSTSDIVFVTGTQTVNVTFLSGLTASLVSSIRFNGTAIKTPNSSGEISIDAFPINVQTSEAPFIAINKGNIIRILGVGPSAGTFSDYICIKAYNDTPGGSDSGGVNNLNHFMPWLDFVERIAITKKNPTFTATTGASISPDFHNKIDKYTSNYAGGNAVLIDFPSHIPGFDDEFTLVVKNTKGSDVTFVISTGVDGYLGVNYNYFMMQADSIVVPSGKRVEISYLRTDTGNSTCDVSIMYKVQE